MDNDQWLAWRRKGIGASDAPIIMQVSPWRTPHQLWQEKVYGEGMQEENSSMRRGKEREAEARTWLEGHLNVTLFPVNVEHESLTWMRASFDCLDLEGKVSAEIKWPSKEDHKAAKAGKVPDKYWPQVQHQIKVKELPGTLYVSCYGDEKVIVEVPRDGAYIECLVEEEREFWNRVVEKDPPPLTDRDFISMEDNKEWTSLTNQWKEVKALLDEVEAKEKEIRTTLISLSNDRSAYGNGVRISKSLVPGHLDYKQAIDDYITQLRTLHPEIKIPALLIDPYRKKHFTKWNVSPIRKKST